MATFHWIAVVVSLLVALFGVTLGAARLSDGPLGPIPGGPLEAGELAAGAELDLTTIGGNAVIELQSSGRSRTAALFEHEGRGYVPAIVAFPPGKSWHQEALSAPDALIRHQGKRYAFRLQRVTDDALHLELIERFVAVYGDTGQQDDPGWIWFFEVTNRPSIGASP